MENNSKPEKDPQFESLPEEEVKKQTYTRENQVIVTILVIIFAFWIYTFFIDLGFLLMVPVVLIEAGLVFFTYRSRVKRETVQWIQDAIKEEHEEE